MKGQHVEIVEPTEEKKQSHRRRSKRTAWFQKLGVVRKYATGEKSYIIRNHVNRIVNRVLEGTNVRMSKGARNNVYLATKHIVGRKLAGLYDDFNHNHRITVYPEDVDYAFDGKPKPRDSFFITTSDFHKTRTFKNRPF